VEERESSTTFLMTSPDNVKKAKALLRKFREEFISVFDPELKTSGKARLFAFTVNFFPVGKNDSKRRPKQ
jgi:hypothetical protein